MTDPATMKALAERLPLVCTAAEACDWSAPSIGNKAVLQELVQRSREAATALEAAAAEIERLRGGVDRQDIATAPKDGTWFVAEQDGGIYPCEWAVEEDGEGGRREGWFDHLNQSFEEPTHWWPPEPTRIRSAIQGGENAE
jgi:hypothetical protein